MKKLLIYVFCLILSGVLMAKENKKEVYIPNSELIDFILQSMLDSVPQPWYSTQMIVTIQKTEEGRNSIDADYTYKKSISSDDKIYQVANIFGPSNAANRLKRQMEEEGKNWTTAIISINSSGKYEVDYK